MNEKNVNYVVKKQLCLGCGACGVVNSANCIEFNQSGAFNFPEASNCIKCGLCLKVCPGLGFNKQQRNFEYKHESIYIGKYQSIFIAHSSDKKIRFSASSGGIVTQILLYLIGHHIVDKAIFVRRSDKNPIENDTVITDSREEIINGMGSRYYPVSPCLKIKDVLNDKTNKKYVFVGKGCDIEGMEKLKEMYPNLTKKIFFSTGIFCDHIPSRKALEEFLKIHGIEKKDIREISYRGRGWPGFATIKFDKKESFKIPYEIMWQSLKGYNFSNFRCSLCPDGMAELADISVGDPWIKKKEISGDGDSLVICRTTKAEKIFKELIQEKLIYATTSNEQDVINSQKGIVSKKSRIWMRIIILKILRIKYPVYQGWHLYDCWQQQSVKNKIISILNYDFIYLLLRRILNRY